MAAVLVPHYFHYYRFRFRGLAILVSRSKLEPLTADKVENLMQNMDRAVQAKDVDGVLRLYENDVVVQIRQPDKKVKSLPLRDYRVHLINAFQLPTKYELAVAYSHAWLIDDGRRAVVTRIVTEKFVLAGKMAANSLQTFVVEMRDGVPKIVQTLASQM
jgi:hypothetical protein